MNFLKNWKTTVPVIIGGLLSLISAVVPGVDIPQEAIITVVVFFVGWFAKDGDKTGTEAQPR